MVGLFLLSIWYWIIEFYIIVVHFRQSTIFLNIIWSSFYTLNFHVFTCTNFLFELAVAKHGHSTNVIECWIPSRYWCLTKPPVLPKLHASGCVLPVVEVALLILSQMPYRPVHIRLVVSVPNAHPLGGCERGQRQWVCACDSGRADGKITGLW
jgi:hypothetical protein